MAIQALIRGIRFGNNFLTLDVEYCGSIT